MSLGIRLITFLVSAVKPLHEQMIIQKEVAILIPSEQVLQVVVAAGEFFDFALQFGLTVPNSSLRD